MASSKTFSGISVSVWSCIKSTSAREHNTTYDPPDANSGVSKTPTTVGTVTLDFSFNPSDSTVAYKIEDKPFIVTEDEIWSGIQQTVNSCGGGGG